MNCPKCGFSYSVVKDSRNTDIGKRRRRQCAGCGYRYNVIEILEDDYRDQNKMLKSIKLLKMQMEDFLSEYQNIENKG